MTKSLSLIIAFISLLSTDEYYVKNYYSNGEMKEQGWMQDNEKIKYWFYYYENGNKKEEGHYVKNNKSNWWILYDRKEIVQKKMEYKNNELHGFTLIYENGDVVKAEKLSKKQKVQEWISVANFKKDNPDFFKW